MKTKASNRVDPKFFLDGDVTRVAKGLLGKMVFTSIDSKITGGMIVEVEAYSGNNDKACHANNGLRTKRTEVMYYRGGHVYVYLCYGIHHMLNIVTNVKGKADAVLIRAIEPIEGLEIIRRRRNIYNNEHQLLSGPGKLTKGLGIDMSLNKENIAGNNIWIEEGKEIPLEKIESDRRVGVDYAGDDALKPWRFFLRDNNHVSYSKQKSKL